MHGEPETEMNIVIQIRTRRDDPIDETSFD